MLYSRGMANMTPDEEIAAWIEALRRFLDGK